MKPAQIISLAALGLTLVPPVLFALGWLGDARMKACLLLGTVLWFGAAPRWLKGGTD